MYDEHRRERREQEKRQAVEKRLDWKRHQREAKHLFRFAPASTPAQLPLPTPQFVENPLNSTTEFKTLPHLSPPRGSVSSSGLLSGVDSESRSPTTSPARADDQPTSQHADPPPIAPHSRLSAQDSTPSLRRHRASRHHQDMGAPSQSAPSLLPKGSRPPPQLDPLDRFFAQVEAKILRATRGRTDASPSAARS
jgi:hypothetical protein